MPWSASFLRESPRKSRHTKSIPLLTDRGKRLAIIIISSSPGQKTLMLFARKPASVWHGAELRSSASILTVSPTRRLRACCPKRKRCCSGKKSRLSDQLLCYGTNSVLVQQQRWVGEKLDYHQTAVCLGCVQVLNWSGAFRSAPGLATDAATNVHMVHSMEAKIGPFVGLTDAAIVIVRSCGSRTKSLEP